MKRFPRELAGRMDGKPYISIDGLHFIWKKTKTMTTNIEYQYVEPIDNSRWRYDQVGDTNEDMTKTKMKTKHNNDK